MTKFVLEILDGERAGTVLPLGEGQVKIGRRSDNDVVIPDEKCSGHHATVEFEDGRHVLRDHGSTNGTLIDGHRVEEVALSLGDVVQLGRVRVCFRAEGEPAAMEGLRVERIDSSRLTHSRRRSSTALLGVLIVVAAGVGAYVVWGRGGGPSGSVRPAVARPLEVEGNLLASTAANLEEDGAWNLEAVPSAAPFDIAVGRARAHSGSAALSVVPLQVDDDVRRFGLARLAKPVTVTSGMPLEVAAWVRTSGAARAAVRLWFGSSVEERSIRTGTAPKSATEDWERLSLSVRAPSGLDRAWVEVLALLPDDESEVLVDDVALVRVADAPGVSGGTRNGRVLSGAGAAFRIDGTVDPTLLGVVPIVQDPILAAVAADGVAAPSDAGVSLTVEPIEESGFRFTYRGGDGVRGLRVLLPAIAAGVRSRGTGEDAPFVEQGADFEADGVTEILYGTPDGRGLLRLAEPAAVRGALGEDSYRIELIGSRSFSVFTLFTDEALRARELEREARVARRSGRVGDALRNVRELVDRVPHDVSLVRSALTLRNEILAEQEERVQVLQRDAVSASFFEARVGYERVITGLDEVISRYGEENVQRLDELLALRGRMTEGIATLDRRAAGAHASQLGGLADAFAAAGDDQLAELLRGYVERHYAALVTEAPQDGEEER